VRLSSRLLSPKVQEAFYSRIADRYLAFCTDAGDGDALQRQFASLALADTTSRGPRATPPPTAASSRPGTAPGTTGSPAPTTPPAGALAQILTALRKLREGIVAAHRTDEFASQAYLFSIRLGILAGAPETYHPALLHLLRAIHPAHNLTRVEQAEAAAYLVLDAACRRGDLAGAFALRNAHGLRDAAVDRALRALVTDNWVRWRAIKASVDAHRARLMDFAERGVRGHTLKAFGRSYLSVPLGYLEAQTGARWAELQADYAVGWELDDKGRVVIRKVQART
jgi:hypothetical protein